jgi:acylphosphatase
MDGASASDSKSRAIRFRVLGRVQGVGFRFYVLRAAHAAGVTGWVRNRPDGSVEALAAGGAEALESFRAALRRGPPASAVRRLEEVAETAAEPFTGFEIR